MVSQRNRLRQLAPLLPLLLLPAALLALVQCGGPALPAKLLDGSLSGVYFIGGRVSGAQLSMVRKANGYSLGTATTGPDGSFRFDTAAEGGPFIITVSGGQYQDITNGKTVDLGSTTFTVYVPDFNYGDQRQFWICLPTIGASLLTDVYAKEGQSWDQAASAAFGAVNAHFGNLDWTNTGPLDLSLAGQPLARIDDPAARAGLVLAGLAVEAQQISQETGGGPGSVTAFDLTLALLADLRADSFFDGQGSYSGEAAAQLLLPKTTASSRYALDGQTMRAKLADALVAFVNGPLNHSLLTTSITSTMINQIASDTTSPLFRDSHPQSDGGTDGGNTTGPGDGGMDGGSDGGTDGGTRFTPPVVVFVSPAPGSTLSTPATFTAKATSAANTITSFSVQKPAALAQLQPTGLGTATAQLSTQLIPSQLGDGNLDIEVVAIDSLGNSSQTQTLHLVVSVNAPTLDCTLTQNQTVSGLVHVVVTATASSSTKSISTVGFDNQSAFAPGSISGLTTSGIGIAGTPAQLAFDWDTTKTLMDGSQTLKFSATDSNGAPAPQLVRVVQVVNYHPEVKAYLNLGAPVAGASCEVVALNNATAQVDTTVGLQGLLGSGCTNTSAGTTDQNGLCDLKLVSSYNYSGPIQIVCNGAPSYTSPRDGKTQVAVPQQLSLTSIFAHFNEDDSTNNVLVAPVDYVTTLADKEMIVYAQGGHPQHPGTHLLSDSQPVTDLLWVKHYQQAGSPQWFLRTTLPGSLTSRQTLGGDVFLAAVNDVSLDLLAFNLANQGGLGAAYTAPVLVQSLLKDLDDGVLDGADNGQPVLFGTVQLDINTMRVTEAYAFDKFINGPTNQTGETSAQLIAGQLYATMAGDTSDLFHNGGTLTFDNQAPSIRFLLTYDALDGSRGNGPIDSNTCTQPCGPVSGVLHLEIDATTPFNGVTITSLSAFGPGVATLAQDATNPAQHYTIDTVGLTLKDKAYTFAAQAKDSLGQITNASFIVSLANAAPTFTQGPTSFVDGTLGNFFGGPTGANTNTLIVDETAVDPNNFGILSFDPISATLPGFINSVQTPRISGNWLIPTSWPQGTTNVTLHACTVAHVCGSATRTFVLDRTAPNIDSAQFSGLTVPGFTGTNSVTLVVRASDPLAGGQGVGVAAVKAQQLSGSGPSGSQGPGTVVSATAPDGSGNWTLSVPLGGTDQETYTIGVWAVDRLNNVIVLPGTPGPQYQQLTIKSVTAAPAPTVTATYAATDGSSGNPVLNCPPSTASPLSCAASGVLTLVVSISPGPLTSQLPPTSPSLGAGTPGVQGGAALQQGQAKTGSWTATYTVNTAGSNDGPFTFPLAFTDALGHASSGSFALNIVNAVPTVTIAAPADGLYYSGSTAAAEFKASINSTSVAPAALLSVTPGGLFTKTPPYTVSGTAFDQTDTISMPGAGADNGGPYLLTLDGVSVTHVKAAQASANIRTDNSAPSVSFTSSNLVKYGSSYLTTVSPLTLDVTVDDGNGAGPANLYWQIAGGPTQHMAIGTSSKSVLIHPMLDLSGLLDGHYTIKLWADDKAIPTNSGQNTNANTFDLLLEKTAPIPALKANNQVLDETNLVWLNTVGHQYAGVPDYKYNGPKGAVRIHSSGDTVYKALTRMWFNGSPPTVSELTGQNPRNFPFLDFNIPDTNVTRTTSCAFTITVSGQQSTVTLDPIGHTVKLGSSLLSGANWTMQDGSGTWCYLPITSDTVPTLDGLTNPATVSVKLQTTDGANNTYNPPDTSFTFTPTAPPIYWAEVEPNSLDATWANNAAYKQATGSYSGLFGGSFPTQEGPRYARFELGNPEPYPLALSFSTPTWERDEEWDDQLGSTQSPGPCYASPTNGDTTGYTCGSANVCNTGSQSPVIVVSNPNGFFNVYQEVGCLPLGDTGGSPPASATVIQKGPAATGFYWKSGSSESFIGTSPPPTLTQGQTLVVYIAANNRSLASLNLVPQPTATNLANPVNFGLIGTGSTSTQACPSTPIDNGDGGCTRCAPIGPSSTAPTNTCFNNGTIDYKVFKNAKSSVSGSVTVSGSYKSTQYSFVGSGNGGQPTTAIVVNVTVNN